MVEMTAYGAVVPMNGFLTGADPECFVVDREGNYVSAEGLIPGTKEEPYKVEGGAIQVDGMAAEFNIDPASNFEEFDSNIKKVVTQLRTHLPKGYGLDFSPAVEFSEEIWEKTPEKAKELGCSPDFNAWTGGVNSVPFNEDNPRLRCAGGHIHVGWTDGEDASEEHMTNCRDLVKQLDWYLGAWSVRADPDPRRRLLYGKSGAFRYKPYGAEYRVLSNFWVPSRGKRLEVWNRLHRGIHDIRTNFFPEKRPFDCSTLREMIDKSTINHTMEKYFAFPIRSLKMNNF